MIHFSTSAVPESPAVIVVQLCTLLRTAGLSGRELQLVILWNNSKRYQRFPMEGALWPVHLRFRPVGSSAFRFSWEDQVAFEMTGGADHEKKKTLASCSTLYLGDHQRGPQCDLKPFEWHLSANRSGRMVVKYLVAEVNLSYKQIFLIQYSILRDWPLVREERSINKLSQGLLILWFPQTLNCHGERQGRAQG